MEITSKEKYCAKLLGKLRAKHTEIKIKHALKRSLTDPRQRTCSLISYIDTLTVLTQPYSFKFIPLEILCSFEFLEQLMSVEYGIHLVLVPERL